MCYCITPLFLEQTKYFYQLRYVVLYAQCSIVSSMAHTSQRTQSTTTMETRVWSYSLPWQLGCDWPTPSLTHSFNHTYMYMQGEVPYHHEVCHIQSPQTSWPVIMNQSYRQRYMNILSKCQLEGHNKRIFTIFFHITFSKHGTNNTVCLTKRGIVLQL
jgi:hypothetical protein